MWKLHGDNSMLYAGCWSVAITWHSVCLWSVCVNLMKESCSRTVPICMWHDQLNALLWEVFKLPACSMDLSSCNFHIFGPFKKDTMTIGRRLWYSGIGGCPRNFFADGYANLCISGAPASVPIVIYFSLWVHLNGFQFIICASYVAYFCAQFRLVVVGLGGLLTRVRYILQCLPLYVSILWMLQSTVISSKYQVEDILGFLGLLMSLT